MLRGGAEEYASAPWVPIWPGLAITVAVFGFNLFGDAVRDIPTRGCARRARRRRPAR